MDSIDEKFRREIAAAEEEFKQDIVVAVKKALLPELAEIKQGQAELKALLDKVIKRVERMGRPKDDFDHLEDLQAAGLSNEQAVALVRVKYEMNYASKADLDETGLKVEGDLKAAGFNPKMAKTIVDYMKDRVAS